MIISSDQTAMDRVIKTNIDDVGQVLDLDFRRMGMGVLSGSITFASSTKITFQSDTSGSGTPDVTTWSFDTSQGVSETPNPDDHPLYRIVNGVSHRVGMAISSFQLQYTMKDGSVTNTPSDLANIRRIDVQMVNESPGKVGNQYLKTYWEKLYIPANIQF